VRPTTPAQQLPKPCKTRMSEDYKLNALTKNADKHALHASTAKLLEKLK